MEELIRFEHVSHSYGGEPVLVGIDLPIHAGAFVGIVGPSGSGKTTLLRLMTGAARAVSGKVVRAQRLTVGYVPQVETVNWFFPLTVREAVMMARVDRRLPWSSRSEIADADDVLARLGIADLAGRHIRALSGGQQQRVFIARALLKRPQLLLMDEPTSGVDVRTRHDVVHLLHELHHEGLAIVVTTHDLNGIAAHLPHLVCLNKEIIATGEPRAVLIPDVLERTYGAPMEVLTHGGMPVVVETAPLAATVPAEEGEHHEHTA